MTLATGRGRTSQTQPWIRTSLALALILAIPSLFLLCTGPVAQIFRLDQLSESPPNLSPEVVSRTPMAFGFCYSPTGDRLVVSTELGAEIWDAATLRMRQTIDSHRAFFCSWSPDGSRIAFAGPGEGEVTIAIPGSNRTDRASIPTWCSMGLAWLGDRDLVLSSELQISIVRLVDGQDGLNASTLYSFSAIRTCAQVSGWPGVRFTCPATACKDGGMIAASLRCETNQQRECLVIWDTATLQPVLWLDPCAESWNNQSGTLQAEEERQEYVWVWVVRLEWSPSSNELAYLSNRGLGIWSIENRAGQISATHRTIGLRNEVEAFAWSPDGKRIVAASRSALFIIDLGTGSSYSRTLPVSSSWISGSTKNRLEWSPDGETIAFLDRARCVYLFASSTLNLEGRIGKYGSSLLKCVKINDHTFAGLDTAGQVRLFNLTDGAVTTLFSGLHVGWEATDLSYSKETGLVTIDGLSVSIWDLGKGLMKACWNTTTGDGGLGPPLCGAVSPECSRVGLIYSCRDNTSLEIREIRTGEVLQAYVLGSRTISYSGIMAWSPSGRMVCYRESGVESVKVCNLATGSVTVVEHLEMVGVAWLSHDRFLATSDGNRTLIWDVRHPRSTARWVIPYGLHYFSLSPSGYLASDGEWIYAGPSLSRIYRLQAPEDSLSSEYGPVVWMGDDLVVVDKWPCMASYKLPWHPTHPPSDLPEKGGGGAARSLLFPLLFYLAVPVWFVIARYRTFLGLGLARVLDSDPIFLGLLGFSRLLDASVTLFLVESRGELNLFTRFVMERLGLEATLLILTPTPIILAILLRRYIAKGEARARGQGRDEDAVGLRWLARFVSIILLVSGLLPVIWNGLVT